MQNLYKDVSFLDKKCYEKFNLLEDILMEHAAEGVNRYIRDRFKKESKILIVSGPGNNGGDGVALARLLERDYKVSLFMPYGAKSTMCKIQLDRFFAIGGSLNDDIKEYDVIVDALFGSGLSKPLKDGAIFLIEKLNSLNGFKIAVDIPSGIDLDGNPLPVAFKADVTLTMGALKSSLFMDFAKDFVGDVIVIDLGVSRKLYEEPSNMKLLDKDDLKPPYRKKLSSHKGDYGHLAVICGEKEGAAIIAALSALNFGAGLVTVIINEKIEIPYELMHSNSLPKGVNAIAVGMGLGKEYSDEDFNSLVLKTTLPIVVDADLFYSQKIKELLKKEKIILTPHPKEFASMLEILNIAKVDAKTIQKNRLKFTQEFCKRYKNVVLVLKGANPIIAQDDRIFINPHGQSSLSKGGSGDVLTGLIASLLAQGYEPLDAAIQGSLAHSIGSTLIKKSSFALTPSNLIEAIGCL